MFAFQLCGRLIKTSIIRRQIRSHCRISFGFFLTIFLISRIFDMITNLCAQTWFHRKFRHSVAEIDCNPTGAPLEIGTSLATGGEKNRMTFLERDKRLFTARKRSPLRQTHATALATCCFLVTSRPSV